MYCNLVENVCPLVVVHPTPSFGFRRQVETAAEILPAADADWFSLNKSTLEELLITDVGAEHLRGDPEVANLDPADTAVLIRD